MDLGSVVLPRAISISYASASPASSGTDISYRWILDRKHPGAQASETIQVRSNITRFIARKATGARPGRQSRATTGFTVAVYRVPWKSLSGFILFLPKYPPMKLTATTTPSGRMSASGMFPMLIFAKIPLLKKRIAGMTARRLLNHQCGPNGRQAKNGTKNAMATIRRPRKELPIKFR